MVRCPPGTQINILAWVFWMSWCAGVYVFRGTHARRLARCSRIAGEAVVLVAARPAFFIAMGAKAVAALACYPLTRLKVMGTTQRKVCAALAHTITCYEGSKPWHVYCGPTPLLNCRQRAMRGLSAPTFSPGRSRQ